MSEDKVKKAGADDVDPPVMEQKVQSAEVIKPEFFRSIVDVVAKNEAYEEVVIEGLLRRREIMTLVSTSKQGKSWCIGDLALSAASGRPWLGMNIPKKLRVCVIDSELFEKTIGMRNRAIAKSRGIEWSEVMDNLQYVMLREIGLIDINECCRQIALQTGSGGRIPGFDLIIFDPLYRLYPAGMNENDNHLMASLYNTIDGLARAQRCSIVIVHHATKGNQSAKDVTEVGSGAGAMTRATDTHLIFRQHQDPDAVVMESVVRTFPRPDPRCLRWQYPVWTDAPDLSPLDYLKPSKNGAKKDKKNDTPEPPELSPSDFAARYVTNSDMTWKQVADLALKDGYDYPEKRVRSLLKSAVISGIITESSGRSNTKLYSKTMLESTSDFHGSIDSQS